MPGFITPLPVILEEEDRKAYEKLEAPKSLVVRYGYQKLVAELPYDGTAKPGCGSKIVIRTDRGVEMGEMLTSTCPNAGCSKSVSRKEMLEYIENSGGKDYPFTSQGKAMRVATVDDLIEQSKLDARKPAMIKQARTLAAAAGLPMKIVEVEPLLGGERIIFYYTAEQWIDFRELVKDLAAEYQTRIEMHQVNAREEARLVADYEKCGQHCCCKQFLKVLKPVSMRSAKVQKATLDPMKISGRCGRLMCCLRYEDETYDDLRKRLPNRKSLVETEDGIGIVLDTQVLTQLALVQVGDAKPAAYAVEAIRVLSKEEAQAYRAQQTASQVDRPSPSRSDSRHAAGGASGSASGGVSGGTSGGGGASGGGGYRGAGGNGGNGKPARPRSEPRRPQPGQPLRDDEVESREGTGSAAIDGDEPIESTDEPSTPEADGAEGTSEGDSGGVSGGGNGDGQPRRRRRRRRRRGGGGGGESGKTTGGA